MRVDVPVTLSTRVEAAWHNMDPSLQFPIGSGSDIAYTGRMGFALKKGARSDWVRSNNDDDNTPLSYALDFNISGSASQIGSRRRVSCCLCRSVEREATEHERET